VTITHALEALAITALFVGALYLVTAITLDRALRSTYIR